jgi:hypothetical protein
LEQGGFAVQAILDLPGHITIGTLRLNRVLVTRGENPMFVLNLTGRPCLIGCTAVLLLALIAGCGVAPGPEGAQPPGGATPAAAPLTLDLNTLDAQLKATDAIGALTKIALKNQVDDLKQKFREHHEGKTTRTMTDLRRSYNLLLMKVLSLLQDTDKMLASKIVSSREAIWGLLSDKNTFANL